MKYPIRMNEITRGLLLVVSALLLFACGGDESMAPKSAAAHREAQAKDIPFTGGHDHGGHEAATATSGTVEMDHAAHGAAGAVDHAAMGHGTADHAQHGTTTPAHDHHAGMQHGATTPGADPHAQHRQPAAGAQMDHAGHGAPAAAGTDPHAGHAMPGAAAAPTTASAPRSNAEMRSVQPSSTLQPDVFDAPAASSVAEAAKAAQGGGHEGHSMRGITPGTDRENPPTPMPATRDRKKN